MKKTIIIIATLLTLIAVSASPVYAAVGPIIGPDVIYKENNEIISINDITSLYSSSGGTIIVEEDNFTGYGHIVGNRTILLKSTDGLAEITREITVTVTSNKIPDVEISGTTYNLFRMVGKSSDSYIFVAYQDKTITVEDMRDTLISLGQLTIIEPSSKNILLDEYTANKTTPGIYNFNFRIMDATGLIKTFYTKVKVQQISEDWEALDPPTTGGLINIDWSIIGTVAASIFSLGVLFVIVLLGVAAYKRFNKKVKKGG